MDKSCNEAEGVRLLETMRRICSETGCEDIEHATLAYEEALQKTQNHENSERIGIPNMEWSFFYYQNDKL